MAEERCDWANLDAIWISHFHLDHCGGLAPFLFGTKYAPETQGRSKPMRIFGPPGIAKLIGSFDSAYDYGLLEQPFPSEIVEIEPGTEFEILDGVSAKTFSTPHTDESCAIRLEGPAGHSMVFTSDTGYSTNLAVFARDAGLLLIECSFVSETPVKIHLDLADIGQIARFAKPKTIVLTHFYPEWDKVNFNEVVSERLPGCDVVEATDGLRLQI